MSAVTGEHRGDPVPENVAEAGAGEDALEAALMKQIEYYFSRENLQQDHYLVNQMNSELFVPISIIAQFKKVATMTTDLEIIKKVMRTCPGVKLNEAETMVRPNIKIERNTIILREISSDTPVKDIRSIFNNDQCGAVKEIHPDVGDTWFVKFDNEEATMRTFMYLQNAKFMGKPVRCRVKTENLLRTLQHASQAHYQAHHQPAGAAPDVVAAYYQGSAFPGPGAGQWPPYQGAGGGAGAVAGAVQYPTVSFGSPPGSGPFFPEGSAAGGQAAGSGRGGGARRGKRGEGGRGGGHDAASGRQQGGRENRGAAAGSAEAYDAAHYAAAPAAKGPAGKHGFGHEYIRFSREEICAVIRALPPPERPVFPDLDGASPVMLEEPEAQMELWRDVPPELLSELGPPLTPPTADVAAPPADGRQQQRRKPRAGSHGGRAHDNGEHQEHQQQQAHQSPPQQQQQTHQPPQHHQHQRQPRHHHEPPPQPLLPPQQPLLPQQPPLLQPPLLPPQPAAAAAPAQQQHQQRPRHGGRGGGGGGGRGHHGGGHQPRQQPHPPPLLPPAPPSFFDHVPSGAAPAHPSPPPASEGSGAPARPPSAKKKGGGKKGGGKKGGAPRGAPAAKKSPGPAAAAPASAPSAKAATPPRAPAPA